MNLFKQIINDTNIYILKNKKLLIIPIYFFVWCYYIKMQIFNIDNTINADIADYVFYIFQGNDPIIKTKDMTMPIFWIGSLFLELFITIGLVQESTKGYGIQILVRSRSKFRWWISKCITVFIFTVIYFLMMHITILIFCFVNKSDLKFIPTSKVIEILFDSEVYSLKEDFFMETSINLFTLYTMPLLTLYTLNLLQLFFNLRLNSIISFMITNCCILLSVYTDSPLAFVGYAMIHRNIYYVENGMNITAGLLILFIIICICIILGSLIFKKKDIL